MLLETRFEKDLIVITPLEQRVDTQVAAAFRSAIVDRIDQGHRRLLINLERVDFIDSSGLGALLSGLRRVGAGGEISVCSLRPRVRALFEVTKLDRVITIADPHS